MLFMSHNAYYVTASAFLVGAAPVGQCASEESDSFYYCFTLCCAASGHRRLAGDGDGYHLRIIDL